MSVLSYCTGNHLRQIQTGVRSDGVMLPNCGIAFADEAATVQPRSHDWAKNFARVLPGWWEGARRMEDALNSRLKYAIAFVIAAVIAAALLRHTVHVYGGFTREEIRVGALIALPMVFVLFLARRRRR
jgi:hypothetical protein